MSRAYKIKVSESLRRVIRGHDKVSTHLDILGILPSEQMGELLATELERRGYTRQGSELVKNHNGVTVAVSPATGMVTASSESSEEVALEQAAEGLAFDDIGPDAIQAKMLLRQKVMQQLEAKAGGQESELQIIVTERLEKELGGLKKELDRAVNRVTAEALKRKAAQLGQIKELTEDPQSGSMTIVLEV